MHRRDRAEIEFAIEVREQLAVARAFPFERIAQHVRVNGNQEQAGLAGKMLSCGLSDLRCGREMDEAVADVDRAASEHTLPLRFAPGRCRADLVDLAHEGTESSWSRRVRSGSPLAMDQAIMPCFRRDALKWQAGRGPVFHRVQVA